MSMKFETTFLIFLFLVYVMGACAPSTSPSTSAAAAPAAATTTSKDTAPVYQPHVLNNSQLRVLPISTNGRQYQLHVGLPDSYSSNQNKKYPVVYVTDAYWDFNKIMGIRGTLVYDKVVPEFIVVGLGYAGENLNYSDLRRLELSPVPFGEPKENSGRATEFLQLLKNDIIPFVEGQYHADPSYRVLSGASLGGLFTLYTMYTEPGLFHGYIAASPGVTIGNDWIFDYEKKIFGNNQPPKGRLYMTVGEYDLPDFKDSIIRMNDRIILRQHPDLRQDFRIIEGERHAGMVFESYVRGLRFVLEPLAPETGPPGL